jgi:hypothetical protein
MSLLIISTPRLNRVINILTLKFNLSVITYSEMRSSQVRVRGRGVRDNNVFQAKALEGFVYITDVAALGC